MQFRLKDLFWCVTLAGVSMGCLTYAIVSRNHRLYGLVAITAFLSVPLACAAIGALFRAAWKGALAGLFLWLCYAIYAGYNLLALMKLIFSA